VLLLGALDESKASAELPMQRFSIIAHYFEPAAFRRAFAAKRTDNDVTAGLHGADDLSNIRITLARLRKKMKDCTVMPKIVCSSFQLDFGDIGHDPTDLLSGGAQSLLGSVDCGPRDIQNGDVLVISTKKVVHEGRFATPHVDNGGRAGGACSRDQSKGSLKVWTIPTDRLMSLGCVDLVPMILCIHDKRFRWARTSNILSRNEA